MMPRASVAVGILSLGGRNIMGTEAWVVMLLYIKAFISHGVFTFVCLLRYCGRSVWYARIYGTGNFLSVSQNIMGQL